MKKILLLILSIISINAFSQVSELENDIKKMLQIQGIEKNWNIIMTRIIQSEKESNPKIESDFWIKFQKEILENSYSKFYNSIIPIYKKHLTKKEVNSIIKFYETDAGKSLILKTPLIIRESMDVGNKLGKEIATQIINDIKKEKTYNYDVINSGCTTFKEGKFKFEMPDGTFAIIKRSKKFQHEYYNGKKTKYKIKWLNDCRYTLSILKAEDKLMESLKGKILITNIYETGSKYYKFVSTIEELGFKLDGIIYKTE